MAKFAEGTVVPVAKSRGEIEALVERAGATKFMSFFEAERAVIGFAMNGRFVRFDIALPDRTEKRFVLRPRSSWQADTIDNQKKRYDAELRRIWRSLLLVIKAKLESVESEITTFEQEFMPFIVTRDGRTIGQILLPQLDQVTDGADMTRLLVAPLGGERA
jgi:hypothetical protein